MAGFLSGPSIISSSVIIYPIRSQQPNQITHQPNQGIPSSSRSSRLNSEQNVCTGLGGCCTVNENRDGLSYTGTDGGAQHANQTQGKSLHLGGDGGGKCHQSASHVGTGPVVYCSKYNDNNDNNIHLNAKFNENEKEMEPVDGISEGRQLSMESNNVCNSGVSNSHRQIMDNKRPRHVFSSSFQPSASYPAQPMPGSFPLKVRYCPASMCLTRRIHAIHKQILDGVEGADVELNRYLPVCSLLQGYAAQKHLSCGSSSSSSSLSHHQRKMDGGIECIQPKGKSRSEDATTSDVAHLVLDCVCRDPSHSISIRNTSYRQQFKMWRKSSFLQHGLRVS
jgi:hypothetical protein